MFGIDDLALTLLPSLVSYGHKKYKEKNVWRNLFCACRNKLINALAEKDNCVISSVSAALNDEKISYLANKYGGEYEIDIFLELKKELYKYFLDVECDKDYAEFLSNSFINELKERLKITFPDYYRDICIQESIEKIAQDNLEIKKLLAEEDLSVFNIWQIDSLLKNNSKYEINLDFFDFDDALTDNRIIDLIKKEDFIYVIGQEAEEILYYILRIFKKNTYCNDDVFVVTDSTSWARIDSIFNGKIFIPFFQSEQIQPLMNSKTIFICDQDTFIDSKNCITINNRTRKNLFYALDSFVNNPNSVSKIIEKSGCLFTNLKFRLFNGIYSEPKWFRDSNNKNVLVVAALLGSWTPKKHDKDVIEKLAGIPYDRYMEILMPYTDNNNAFIVSVPQYQYTEYRISDLERSWFYLSKYLTDDIRQCYRYFFTEIILNLTIKQDGGIPLVDCGDYSSAIKSGMVRTLIILSRIDNKINKLFVDQCLNDLFDKINDEKEWIEVAQLMPELVEASPAVFVDRVRTILKDEQSAIHCIFKSKTNNIYEIPKYTKLIAALQKALFYPNTKFKTINLVMALTNIKVNDRIIESPINVLKEIFCPILDVLNLGSDRRLELLRSFSMNYPDSSWMLFQKILPTSLGVTHVDLISPYYYDIEEPNKLTYNSTIELVREYFNIAMNNAKYDLLKWSYLITRTLFLDYGFIQTAIARLSPIIKDLNIADTIKYRFSKDIRDYIIYNRRYKHMRVDDSLLVSLEENIYKKIDYTNNIYRLLHLFEENYDLIYPQVYNENDYIEYREEIKRQQQKSQIDILRKALINNQYSIMDILEIVPDNLQIGESLANALSYGLDSNIILKLKNIGKYNILLAYIRALINKIGTTASIECYSNTFNNFTVDVRFVFLKSLNLNIDTLNFIDKLPKEDQDYYWSNIDPLIHEEPYLVVKKAFHNLISANNFKGAFLVTEYNTLKEEDYISFLEKYKNYIKDGGVLCCSVYSIRKIFKEIYKCNQPKINERILKLEVFFIKFLFSYFTDFKPLNLFNRLTTDPIFCLHILDSIYDHDKELNKEIRLIINDNPEFPLFMYCNLHYCPGIDYNNNWNPSIFNNWINLFLDNLVSSRSNSNEYRYLGLIFAAFPQDKYDEWLPNEICKIISSLDNQELNSSFVNACYNKLSQSSSFTISSKIKVLNTYYEYARQLEIKFPIVSDLLRQAASYIEMECEEKRSHQTHDYF